MSSVPAPLDRPDADLLAAIFGAMPGKLLAFDRVGRLRLVNPAAAAWLQDDQAARTIDELAQADTVFAPLIPVLAEPMPDRRRVIESRSERRRRDFAMLVSAWERAFDGERGYVVLMHDITDLLDRSRFKNEMLRLASHDLRSPLALIINYCELLSLEIPEELAHLHQYNGVIRQSAERMQTMLDAVLRVEQVRSSPLELRQSVNPVDLARAVMNNMRLLAAQKSLRLEARFQPDVGELVVDPVLIQEAMENLVGNAIKYTPAGGQIVVKAEAADRRFRFEVEDTGIGVGQEHLPRLFESFYRARQPGTEQIEGTGLGLSLVKAVVERHSGDVWVESQVGRGSRFGFWLPYHTA